MARLFTSAGSKYLDNMGAPITALPITMACWFRNTSATAAIRNLISINTSGSNNNLWQLNIDASELVSARSRTSVNAAAVSATATAVGVWQHAAGIFTSTTSRTAFLNGVAGTTNSTSNAPSAPNAMYVSRSAFAQSNMDGDIAEAAVWRIALGTNDITMLANGFSPLLIKPNDLVWYAPLYGFTTYELDIKGGSRLVLNGSPTQSSQPRIIERA